MQDENKSTWVHLVSDVLDTSIDQLILNSSKANGARRDVTETRNTILPHWYIYIYNCMAKREKELACSQWDRCVEFDSQNLVNTRA